MKTKSIFIIGLLLFTLFSVSAIYADTYVVGNSSFSLPDGYALSEKGNHIAMYNDKYVIMMYEGSNVDPKDAKERLINNGYTFVGERDYDFNGVKINQQNYNYDGVNTCVYKFKKDGQNYLITLNMYEDEKIPENKDNPVSELIDTLEYKG